MFDNLNSLLYNIFSNIHSYSDELYLFINLIIPALKNMLFCDNFPITLNFIFQNSIFYGTEMSKIISQQNAIIFDIFNEIKFANILFSHINCKYKPFIDLWNNLLNEIKINKSVEIEHILIMIEVYNHSLSLLTNHIYIKDVTVEYHMHDTVLYRKYLFLLANIYIQIHKKLCKYKDNSITDNIYLENSNVHFIQVDEGNKFCLISMELIKFYSLIYAYFTTEKSFHVKEISTAIKNNVLCIVKETANTFNYLLNSIINTKDSSRSTLSLQEFKRKYGNLLNEELKIFEFNNEICTMLKELYFDNKL